ncbi:hypothetical protein LXA43DRAFT_888889 [Ganoderma leucocontextum]|nr:hypothetical protein LXA43DRAFT_888889 [Ganoderma leucocontextum]
MRSTAGVVLTTAMTQAEVVQKFELCPGHELSLQSSEPDAFCWGTLEPRDDPRPSWARPQILFRFCDEDPAATESPYDVDVSYDKRRDIGNDILAEMQHHFAFQQLVALYVVIVYDRTAFCVSRWDRSGVVVTKGVDFVAQPHLLAEVFQRLSAATDEQLGFDLTASAVLPGSTDYVLMDRLAEPCAEDSEAFEGTVLEVDPAHPASPPTPTFKVFRGLFARMLQPSDGPARRASAPQIANSRWKLSVPTDDDESRDFFVGRPFQCGDDSNVDWRNTRSYVAFDCTAQRFVFLKDAWRGRGRGDNVESEGDILAMLNAAGVPHVPTVVCHADLQKTVTSKYYYNWHYERGCGAANAGPRLHFRMVVQELGLRFNHNFSSGRQIASVMNDCVVAHAEAAKALKMLHGDLGPYNIMICPRVDAATDPARPTVKWEGMLIDWEAVKWLPGAPNYMGIPNGMGSCCYQSVACVLESEKRFEIADELESFLYTILWCGIRWLHSNCADVRPYLEKVFDYCHGMYGLKPSVWKRRMLERNELLLLDGTELRFHGDRVPDAGDPDSKEGSGRRGETPFDSLLREVLSWCHANAMQSLSPHWNTWRCNGFMHREDCAPGLKRPDAAVPVEDRKALAAKLNNHDAIRELFARKLSEEWPKDDFAGDKWQIQVVLPPKQTDEEDKVEAPAEEKSTKPEEARGRAKAGVTKRKRGRGKAATKIVGKAAPAKRKVRAIPRGSRHSRRLRGEPPLVESEVEERPAKRQRRQ